MEVSQLSCCADNCINYKNGYCLLSSIEVSGVGADSSASTYCSNFEKRLDNFISELKLDSPYSYIKCKAENCIYNLNGDCHSTYVDISGHSANTSEDTLCSTFKTNNM